MTQWRRLQVPHRPRAGIHFRYNEFVADFGDPLFLPIGSVVVWPYRDTTLVQYVYNYAKKKGVHLALHVPTDTNDERLQITVKGRWQKVAQ